MFEAETFGGVTVRGCLISYENDYYIQIMLGCVSVNYGVDISTKYGNKSIESIGCRVDPTTIRQIMSVEDWVKSIGLKANKLEEEK